MLITLLSMYCTIPPIPRHTLCIVHTPDSTFDFFGLCLMGGRRTLMTTGRVLLVALLQGLNVLALTLEGTVVIVVADVARVWLCLGTPTNVSAPL